MMNQRQSRWLFLLGAAGVLLMPAFLPVHAWTGLGSRAPAGAQTAPAPVPAGRSEAVLAGGCFWSMEAIFKQLKGVDRVLPGYSGGRLANPSYEQVETGETGHAETVQIIYNPRVISYRELLQVFFTVRNPTTPNQQGPDVGTQYRSIVFYRDAAQQQIARQTIQQVNASHLWNSPVVTEVVPFTHFYPAEAYHRDYYRLHPDEPYSRDVIAPEIAQFRARFRAWLKR